MLGKFLLNAVKIAPAHCMSHTAPFAYFNWVLFPCALPLGHNALSLGHKLRNPKLEIFHKKEQNLDFKKLNAHLYFQFLNICHFNFTSIEMILIKMS